jgi:hypothetical protein
MMVIVQLCAEMNANWKKLIIIQLILHPNLILVTSVIVIVNKMVRIEDIEDFYKKGAEKLDKEFLEKFSKTKSKKERADLELDYKEKTGSLGEEYNKKIVNYLKEQKNVLKEIEKKKSKNIKKEIVKVFVEKKIDLRDSWKDKMRFKWELFKFRNNIKSKNFRESHIPEFLKIMMIKLKLDFRDFKGLLSGVVSNLFLGTKKMILNLVNYTKETGLFIFGKMKSSFNWISKKISLIFSKIFKNKEKDEKKEKRPDEEIAEKLLKKS